MNRESMRTRVAVPIISGVTGKAAASTADKLEGVTRYDM